MSGPLPNFVIAGAQKCGTTSLAAWLHDHPDVFLARGEVHFFDRDDLWREGIDWYRGRFEGANGESATGEKTPSYLLFPEAVRRMAETLPHARIIVSLRDPVARFYSQWRHMRYKGWLESRSLEEVVQDELRGGEVTPSLHGDRPAATYYLERGRYLTQIRRLLEHYPRERVLIVLADDLKSSPTEALATVCRFLGVDDGVSLARVGEDWNTNEEFHPEWLYSGLRRTGLWDRTPARVKWRMLKRIEAAPMPPALHDRLASYYLEPNAELAEFLGRDLSHWGRR